MKILRSSEEELEQYCSEGLKQSFERMSFVSLKFSHVIILLIMSAGF